MREYHEELTPERLSLDAVQFWRRQVARQRNYWERVCRRMAQTNCCRVNPVYRKSHAIRQELREMAQHLEELEQRVRHRLNPPPPRPQLPPIVEETTEELERDLDEAAGTSPPAEIRYTTGA